MKKISFKARDNSFHSLLNKIKSKSKAKSKTKGAGDVLLEFAKDTSAFDLPGVMTHRVAQQLADFASGWANLSATQILAGLFSGGGTFVRPDEESVEVTLAGELMSLFRPGTIEFAGYNVVLGTRPDFAYVDPVDGKPFRMSADNHAKINFTALLAAKILEDLRFPVDAAGLRWENHLSLAWTEWQDPKASFQWKRHKHPRPDQLLRQTLDWHAFVRRPREEVFKPERYAYAWIYFERKWNNVGADAKLNPMADDFPKRDLDWEALLKFDEGVAKKEVREWLDTTLALFARPEIGLPPTIQAHLLANRRGENTDSSLRDLRHRFVTSAILAARAQRGESTQLTVDKADVDNTIEQINREYARAYGGKNVWSVEIDRSEAQVSKGLAVGE